MSPMSKGIRGQLHFYRFFWRLLPRQRRRQVMALQVIGLLAALAEVASLAALMPFLRVLASPRNGLSSLGPLASLANTLPSAILLPSLALSFMLIVVATAFLRVITTAGQFRLVAVVNYDLSRRIFHNVINRPYAWHLRNNSSFLINTLTKDIDQAVESFKGILGFLLNFIIVLSLATALFFISPILMLGASGIFASFYSVVFRFTQANIVKNGEIQTASNASLIKIMQEGMGGIRDILIDQRQDYFEDAFSDAKRPLAFSNAQINTTIQIPKYLIQAFVMILFVSMALVMALQGKGVEQQLPLLGTFAMGAFRLLQPINNCFENLSIVNGTRASLHHLLPHLQGSKEEHQPVLNPSSCTQSLNFKELNLHQVRFSYLSEGPWVLDGIDLTIHRGERLGLVGSTGSGKSTLVDLILGLLDPSQGEILIDGYPLCSKLGLLQRWQESIAHVPQQIYLSDATFAENIAFGTPISRIDWQRLRVVARQAFLDQVIESQPKGYHTMVGERGVRLSGGQRQRIGIARALYKNAKFLIFDEATSALDNVAEAEVVEAIESLENEITVIMIAHRLSTVKRCDRIILLENGKVAAEGTYSYLLSANHSFRELVDSAGRS